MARPPEEIVAAAEPYVAVKITDMSDVDVARIRFDFDLTFAIVLMHPDGTVYHRFGSRDAGDATRWSSLPVLQQLLADTVADHAEYSRSPRPPAFAGPQRAAELPPLARRLAASADAKCVHCHSIHDAEHEIAVAAGRLGADAVWIYPPPGRVGLELDPLDQAVVAAVAPGSPAAAAGLRPGDRLSSLGRQRWVRTLGDVEWALHGVDGAGGQVPFRYRRGDSVGEGVLELAAGWRRGTPADYAWRPYKWNLSPAPGFGGPLLTAEQRAARGLGDARFAMRVQYVVTWGERAHRGRAALAAGIRSGDVVLSFAGVDDFESVDHFHAWVRLRCRAGQEVEVVVDREGERLRLRMTLPE